MKNRDTVDSSFILISGGGLDNKGAQAMLFILVSELKRRFPKKKIIVLSRQDSLKLNEEKDIYDFKIVSDSTYAILDNLGGINRFIAKIKGVNSEESKNLDYYFSHSDMLCDISGFALSSKRPLIRNYKYLATIKYAKKYKVPVYIFPQSFGPFEYTGIKKFIIDFLIRETLKYPKVIYVREKEGFCILKNRYHLKNIIKSFDMVLMNKTYDIKNIYKKVPDLCLNCFDNHGKNVAIVPNVRLLDTQDFVKIKNLYKSIIQELLKKGRKVYIIRHSTEDLEMCRNIKEGFNENVFLIENDFNCIEYDKIVSSFNYIIGSRYHAIVHALKNGVPCIALGWAEKYVELLSIFGQEEFVFDISADIDEKRILNAIEKIDRDYKELNALIITRRKELKTVDLFNILEQERE